jgi:hypothetical protein
MPLEASYEACKESNGRFSGNARTKNESQVHSIQRRPGCESDRSKAAGHHPAGTGRRGGGFLGYERLNLVVSRLRIVVLSTLFLALPPCAAIDPPPSINSPIDGVVTDTSTGKPIPGVFVIAQWVHHGSDVVGSRTGCPRVVIVQTDAAGRYRIPEADLPPLSSIDRAVFTYRQGYQRDYGVAMDEKVIALKPFTGTTGERIDSFRSYGSLMTCGRRDEIVAILRPLYVAIDEELQALAVPENSRVRARTYTRMLEQMAEALATERKFDEGRK